MHIVTTPYFALRRLPSIRMWNGNRHRRRRPRPAAKRKGRSWRRIRDGRRPRAPADARPRRGMNCPIIERAGALTPKTEVKDPPSKLSRAARAVTNLLRKFLEEISCRPNARLTEKRVPYEVPRG